MLVAAQDGVVFQVRSSLQAKILVIVLAGVNKNLFAHFFNLSWMSISKIGKFYGTYVFRWYLVPGMDTSPDLFLEFGQALILFNDSIFVFLECSHQCVEMARQCTLLLYI